MKKYDIGCSGYYYSTWKNKFYPEGLQPKDWLKYYSTIFSTVELNGTFYHTPKLSDLQNYAAVTVADFTFAVKMSRYITHILRLKQSQQQIGDFQNLIQEGLGSKLSYFLFQLPPTFQYNEENLELVVNNIPNKKENIVEFRHISWWNADVKKVLTDAQLTFCNVDFPELASFFIHTSPVFYLRLHGNPELFKSSYTTPALESFYHELPTACAHYNIYFNNTFYEAGYKNALELMGITKAKYAIS